MTDLTAYRNLFKRTGVSFQDITWPKVFSDSIMDFWHITEDSVTGLAVGTTLFLFDEKNNFIGTAEGDYSQRNKEKVKTFHRRIATENSSS